MLGVLGAPIAVTLALATIPSVISTLRRRLDPFEPILLLGIFYGIGFPISALLWMQYGAAFDSSGSAPFFPKALMLAAAAMTAWYSGYYLPHPRWTPRLGGTSTKEWNLRKLGAAACLLIAGGWTGHLLRILKGGYLHSSCSTIGATWSTTVAWLELLLLAGMGISIGIYIQLNMEGLPARGWGTLCAAAILAEVLYALPTGWRTGLMSLFLVVLATVAYTRGRFPWTTMTILALLAIFGIFPLADIYRQQIHSILQHQQASTCATSISTILEAFKRIRFPTPGAGIAPPHRAPSSGGNPLGVAISKVFKLGLGVTAERLNMLAIVAPIVRWTPSKYPFLMGKTLVETLISFLPPRFLLPKPEIHVGGNAFAHQFQLIGPTDNLTSVGLTRVGELYLNFGTLGVIAGMTVEGYASRTVYQILILNNPRSITGIVLYELYLLAFLQFGAFADYALPIKAAVIVTLIFIWAKRH
jgi:hypothetical protein